MTATPRTNPPYRVLCVDDEESIRDVVAALLRREGFVVETAADGQAAWQRLLSEWDGFDLVITDNEMPRMSGASLIERLHGSRFPGKVLMFSGSLPATAAARLADFGVTERVEKGSGVGELIAAVRRLTTDRGKAAPK